MIKNVLNSPYLYQRFQEIGGFFGARLKGIEEFVELKSGMRVLDIGCGPGYILEHLPPDIQYFGFDIDESYIAHARSTFGNRGQFHCRLFDESTVPLVAPVDLVMMNGVLHHIPDEALVPLLGAIHSALRPGGTLFSLDGCYVPGQSRFNKWMLDNDRGRFVRTEDGYRHILETTFDRVELHIRENYSRVPYTFAIGLSHKAP